MPGGITPVMLAASSSTKEVLQAILAAGADIFATDSMGRTAFHFAAIGGHQDNLETLLAKAGDCEDSPLDLQSSCG